MNRAATADDGSWAVACILCLCLAMAFGIGAAFWHRDQQAELAGLRARMDRLDALHCTDEQIERVVSQGRRDLAGAEREVRP